MPNIVKIGLRANTQFVTNLVLPLFFVFIAFCPGHIDGPIVTLYVPSGMTDTIEERHRNHSYQDIILQKENLMPIYPHAVHKLFVDYAYLIGKLGWKKTRFLENALGFLK